MFLGPAPSVYPFLPVQLNTTKYHTKKAGEIPFSESVKMGRPTLDRCLRDRAGRGGGIRGRGGDSGIANVEGSVESAGRVTPGVVTRPPAVRPDADYRGMPTISRFHGSFSITDRYRTNFSASAVRVPGQFVLEVV